MKRTTFGKAAISSLIVATTMVGCTGAAFRPSTSAAPAKGNPVRLAEQAEKELERHDIADAIAAAEAAVQLAPENSDYRALLGRTYVAAGRFASAQSALEDAVTLGSGDARTIVNLALVHVAQGRADDARNLLVAHADTVPAADYGLAMAMAGDPVEGVRILSEAIHDPSATARTRQNLAYAYALAGRWKDARTVVGMDLEPLAANKRISDWAQIAEPSLAPLRVASLMGVTIDDSDAGQPAMLALAPAAAPVPAEMAQAEPVAELPVADAATQPEASPVQLAAATPQPVVQAVPASKPAPRDFIIEERPGKPVAAKPAAKLAAKAPVKATPVAAASAAKMQQVAFIKPVGNPSQWVVQLGAYDTAAIAKEKWMVMAGRDAMLSAFPVMTSQATVNGKTYHRLAINGFAGRADAMTACKLIKSRNGQCFVRESAPGATPQRWAVAGRGRQFASR
ncbi:Flp pilus assembly protein TadD [Sphingobium sp. OAS761]|uniref:SPOR domain-containing protein n=1 Tax=Sphingobium sp. OAS761 TaxID=2817901 RepID=UPI0020A19496|nr:SPOR domain-containing protein [Sphingobium sp. OAS761]MCP1470491.1 Flp pilus assembly protein TadD [Sphingobium sp. OAS761]